MSEEFITNLEGNAFYQLDYEDEFEWLTCTGVGDITIPISEYTPDYCPDPLNSGKIKLAGLIPGDPAAGTYSLDKPLAEVYNFLIEEAQWPMQLRINWVARGTREDPRNYDVAFIMIESRANQASISAPVRGAGGTSARVSTSLTETFLAHAIVYPIQFTRQTVANLQAANCVHFLPRRQEDRTGPARRFMEIGVIGCDRAAGYLYDSEVKKTEDQGATWAQTTVDPFTYGGNILACFLLETASGERVIAFRGAGVPGAYAEAAYSDDMGATWTNVYVGTVAGQSIRAYCLVGAKIVIACSGGYIYSSIDQGETWSLEEAGVETTEDLNAITSYGRKYVYAVGNNASFLRSVDGGSTWDRIVITAIAGDDIMSVAVNRQGHIFIGTNASDLYRSDDRGVSWTHWQDRGGGSIDWIGFDPDSEYVGIYIHNTSSPRGYVYRTENGGATWHLVPDFPANAGLNGAFMGNANEMYVVGEAYGGTTFIARSTPF